MMRRPSVFHAPTLYRREKAISLSEDCGLILGTLFPNDLIASPGKWRPVVDTGMAESMVKTRGRHLIKLFWGTYIAFLVNSSEREIYIVRDCSGHMPCYVRKIGETYIVFSNINDLSGLSLPPLSMNTRYIAGFLYAPELAQRECAIQDVTEVQAGECLELTQGKANPVTLWDPRVICRENLVEDFEEASSKVLTVTRACIDFWASTHERIVHQLSGGLDSSMVLGCLSHSPYKPEITCLHLEPSARDGSESEFAKLAAHSAKVELIIQSGYSKTAQYDDRMFRLPKSPKPNIANLAMTLEDDFRNAIPIKTRAEAIWDGQGGDHLFFDSQSAFEAVDYAFVHGLFGEFPHHLRGTARQSRMSYWDGLKQSIKLGTLRGAWSPENELKRTAQFINWHALPNDLLKYVWQPWAENADDLPPGKRWQIASLAGLLHRHRPVPELQFAPELHPLFSQPLLELCLTIPIYTLVNGGINRALERHAFQNYVPQSIIRREGKSATTTTLMDKVRQCRPYLRELILGGLLVELDLINQAALEPYLTGHHPVDPRGFWPLMSCITAEVWARRWATDGWRI